ncbi:glutamine-hydrolyzing carbamoyl-phosphate synthase small subunit [Coraliomargarita algicola]|uniref:Carbamoyl phosphate synthase small chain n=2 Tax=Coraliomargaritaceae TaxID=3056371 RepID=A0ABU1AL81_9BACT|nr:MULTISPECIES: glutamine-hydrolyzing carbamoyl-phosphate synthase small subunit [unclassified Coraliomargarita]MDQ8195560.1 glutamine-hydrolyzing carbamoyl-phosphate synthase small subunit [Coraliomargarita sp. SDUM461004]WPJ98191.1 glutamine-hydrolyzing carbamoyl-phosphate synthase small subunit [Coraliomargarita sp. J2-16]
MAKTTRTGLIAFEDGTVFRGRAFGAVATNVGEACFNTSMTGYQEILTDPSYFSQIVTMTAVQIGNYGICPDDVESDGPKVKGFIVREVSPVASNWRSNISIQDYLAEAGIPGIEGVDTRAITKKLRVSGALKACITTEDISEEEAVKRAQEFGGLIGVDFVKEVTAKEAYHWDPEMKQSTPFTVVGTDLKLNEDKSAKPRFKVAAMDFGAKYSIYRKLQHHGFDVHVFPATASAEEIKSCKPDCVFLSNGPGDPGAVEYAHATVKELIEDYPTFGICLGHQIITHALGAKTFKLKFGHRGGNQPVKNLETGKVSITAQNHGFASTREELEKTGAIVTEINLNDDTVEGLRLKDKPVFSVQYHPEAAPGPNDADALFVDFYNMVAKHHG